MKKFHTRSHFHLVLPLLFVALLFTVPLVRTESKYVWKEDIDITLKVTCSEQSLTSYVSAPPDVTCTLEGNGLRIEPTGISGQWILSPEEGYLLPESFTVKINETDNIVFTDGQSNSDQIAFYPETGTLMIADALLADCQGTVTMIASGLPNPDHVTDMDDLAEATVATDACP